MHHTVSGISFPSPRNFACLLIRKSVLAALLLSPTATIPLQTFICFAMYFWRSILIDCVCLHRYSVISHFHVFLSFFFFPVMLYYSYTLMFSLFYSIVAMLLCVVMFAPWWRLSVRKWKDYLLTYLLSLCDLPHVRSSFPSSPLSPLLLLSSTPGSKLIFSTNP